MRSITPRIITSFVTPPIPNADHWQAHDDNLGEDCSPYGIGQTKAEAIADLMWKLEGMSEHVPGAVHDISKRLRGVPT